MSRRHVAVCMPSAIVSTKTSIFVYVGRCHHKVHAVWVIWKFVDTNIPTDDSLNVRVGKACRSAAISDLTTKRNVASYRITADRQALVQIKVGCTSDRASPVPYQLLTGR